MTEIAGQLYTVDEFIKKPEYQQRYELIDGRLVEKPMPKYEHSLIARLILRYYDLFDPKEKTGRMLQEVSVYIKSDYAPTPDLAFWIASRKPTRKVSIAPRPDLAIEIQSPDQSLKILLDKAREYQQAGVALVWLIQPTKKSVLVLRTGQTEFETVPVTGELDGAEVIPGFRLKVANLFEDVED